MATFRTYDRLLFVKTESVEEGVVDAPGLADYVETIEPSFNITNRVFDRNVTRKSITPMLKTVTGSGAGLNEPSATCEFTFGVELAGTGDISAGWASEPVWGKLLKACGFTQLVAFRALIEPAAAAPDAAKGLFDATASHRTPVMMRNRSAISNEGASGTLFQDANCDGRLIGDLSYDDPYAYITPCDQTPAVGAATHRYFSQAAAGITDCNPYFTSDSTLTRKGYGYSLISDSQLGGSGTSNTSSCSITLQLGLTGQYIQAAGCRGNVEFVFTSGDKCVMQFTMTGKLVRYSDGASSGLPTTITQAVPPSVVGMAASINASSFGSGAGTLDKTNAVFNDFSLNMGNELSLREDMNDAVGYEATYITGRSGSMSISPDAGPAGATHTPWWSRLLSGDSTSLRMTLGATAGGDANSFVFKMPALQFEQIGDGERENVMTYDITGSMTGGDNGSSMQEGAADAGGVSWATGESTVLNSRLGTNNEFTLYYT